MRSFKIKFITLMAFCLALATVVNGQDIILRRMKDKMEKKIADDIFKDSEKAPTEQVPQQSETESSSKQNRKGGGLTQTTPDVNQYIADAKVAFDAKKYSEAKAAVKQALWGVELEIGQKILKSLPEKVDNLKMIPERDKVSSSGYGFVGLVIERYYEGKDDMELNVSIGNDAALLGVARMYMASGYNVNSSDNTNQKQIRYKDHNAMIQYDDDSGYSLSVSFGQSSIFVVNGINFETEISFMAAANQFDLNTIKQELGEQ